MRPGDGPHPGSTGDGRPPPTRGGRPVGRRRRVVWLPRQHGAWAMLAVPFLVGVEHTGPSIAHVPLLAAWVLGYLWLAAAGLWLRSRFRDSTRLPVLVYGAACAVATTVVLVRQPGLLAWGPVFAVCAIVSLSFSWRRRDRALVNDVVTIVAACLMAPVAACAGAPSSVAGTVSDPALLVKTVALVAYFVGTALYVKTVIRERGSAGYRRASIGYHAVLTLLCLLLPWIAPGWVTARAAWALSTFFAVATARAWLLAGRTVRPMKVGLGEIALSGVLTVLLWTLV